MGMPLIKLNGRMNHVSEPKLWDEGVYCFIMKELLNVIKDYLGKKGSKCKY